MYNKQQLVYAVEGTVFAVCEHCTFTVWQHAEASVCQAVQLLATWSSALAAAVGGLLVVTMSDGVVDSRRFERTYRLQLQELRSPACKMDTKEHCSL